jgi:hypothetical protein
MLRWSPSAFRSRRGIADAIVSVALGVILSASLWVFTAYRLNEPNWRPQAHDLSEDGRLYLTISPAGLRMHEVATGAEIDRYSFQTPWQILAARPEPPTQELHPFDAIEPESRWIDATGYGVYVREDQKRIEISPSGRYAAIFAPAGYLMIWDRESRRLKTISEPRFRFSAFSFDEEQDRLLIEGAYQSLPIPQGEWAMSFEPEEGAPVEPEEATFSVDVLVYRLSSLERIDYRRADYAGVRINDDRNLRMIYDEPNDELRVSACDDFPYGSQKVLHRVQLKGLHSYARGAFCKGSPRWADGRFYFANRSASAIAFHSDFTSKGMPRKFRLPPEIDNCELDWFGDGSATIHGIDSGLPLLATWDEDHSVALFEVPDETFHNAVVMKSHTGERRLRVAGTSGLVFDLPIGKEGKIESRKTQMAVHPNALYAMLMAIVLSSLAWSIWAALTRTLIYRGGWLVSMLCLTGAGLIYAWDLYLAASEMGLLTLTISWLAVLATGLCGLAHCFARNGRLRGAIVFVAATAALLIILNGIEEKRLAEYRVNRSQMGMY